MKKTLYYLLIVAISLLFSGYSSRMPGSHGKSPLPDHNNLEPGKQYYTLKVIITDPYDPHKGRRVKKVVNNEEVIIFINGNPIGFHNKIFKNKVVNINSWIKKGINTISLKGKTVKKRKLQIENFSKESISKNQPDRIIFSKSLASPLNIKNNDKYSFKVDNINWKKTVFNYKKIPSDKTKIKKEITKILADLHDDFKKKNIKNIKNKLFQSEKKSSNQIEKMLDILLKKYDVEKFNKNKINFIFGKQIVLVYQDFINDMHHAPYLFKFKDKKGRISKFNIYEQKFVYSSKNWLIWR